MRSGKAYLATPLARVSVKANPQASLIDDLESGSFLDRLRRFSRDEQAPTGIRSQVRRLEDALFDLARSSDRHRLQKVLRIAGRICFDLSKSAKAREAVPRLPRLKAAWVREADDGSAEFRCAAALAGLNATGQPLTPYILPVARETFGFWRWAPESRSAVWHEGSLSVNLGRIAARRHLEEAEQGKTAAPKAAAGAADVQRFLAADLDEQRLADLLLGLLLADSAHLPFMHEPVPLPVGYCTLKLLFAPHAQLARLGFLAVDQTLALPGEIIASLRAGNTQRAVNLGWRRLQASDVSVPAFPRRPPAAPGIEGPRLLAALTIPLNPRDLGYCLAPFRAASTRNSDTLTGEPV
jgi:CRISPR-associated protein Csx17